MAFSPIAQCFYLRFYLSISFKVQLSLYHFGFFFPPKWPFVFFFHILFFLCPAVRKWYKHSCFYLNVLSEFQCQYLKGCIISFEHFSDKSHAVCPKKISCHPPPHLPHLICLSLDSFPVNYSMILSLFYFQVLHLCNFSSLYDLHLAMISLCYIFSLFLLSVHHFIPSN